MRFKVLCWYGYCKSFDASRLYMNKKFRLLIATYISLSIFLSEELFASQCEQYFSKNLIRSTITIVQPGSFQSDYVSGICNLDAVEVLYIMQKRPQIFDMSKVRVLILGNVFVHDRTWRSHVAVYDGMGNIYDSAVLASREIRPIPLSEYLRATTDSHGNYTEVRVIEPEQYLREYQMSTNSVWMLFYFGYQMDALGVYQYSAFDPIYKHYRRGNVHDSLALKLPPILRPKDLPKALRIL